MAAAAACRAAVPGMAWLGYETGAAKTVFVMSADEEEAFGRRRMLLNRRKGAKAFELDEADCGCI